MSGMFERKAEIKRKLNKSHLVGGRNGVLDRRPLGFRRYVRRKTVNKMQYMTVICIQYSMYCTVRDKLLVLLNSTDSKFVLFFRHQPLANLKIRSLSRLIAEGVNSSAPTS